MELPLRLTKLKDGSLIYGISPWFRVMNSVFVVLIAAAFLVNNIPMSVLAWILEVGLALGVLYEENWKADSAGKRLVHKGGIYPFIKSTPVDFAEIEHFMLGALARGTVPGSSEERDEKARAQTMMNGSSDERSTPGGMFARNLRRKPFVNLILQTRSGEAYLIDSLPARKAKRLEIAGMALADSCGCQLEKDF